MNSIIRIKCPDANKNKIKRISLLFDSISEWIYSKELSYLIKLFEGDINEIQHKELKTYISWLNNFVEVWDYRKIQAKGGERWNIKDEKFVIEHRKEIMDAVQSLGLVTCSEPRYKPDYILPLGGARLTNISRPQEAKELIDSFGWKDIKIVALSGMRPINDIELPYIKQYAPNAENEYDAINKGLEKVFGLGESFEEKLKNNLNINLKSAVRKYNRTYQGCNIFSLSAPSSISEKRADSKDTFKYFLEKFEVKNGSKLLFVTSCIYSNFQLLKFMDFAIDIELEIDCVGVVASRVGTSLLNPSNYLQEIKATVNAIYSLSETYL